MPSSTRPSGGLEGFAVLVTGGATGIGRACAERLAADGAAVTICGRTPEKLEEAAGRIADAAAHGGSVRFVRADVTVEDDVAAAVKCALEPTGRLDGAVANAGGGGGLGPYHVQDTGEFLRILHLNVLGTMLCIKHTVPHLVAAGGGSFVGMSSIAGHVTHPYFGAYTAGKAGIEAMIRQHAHGRRGPPGGRGPSGPLPHRTRVALDHRSGHQRGRRLGASVMQGALPED
jgi:NAD(P)-dependent dehydrogenase (short-subunit alcohol dehydrogenase family)